MAYNSQQLTLQQPKEPQGFLRRLLTKGQVFPFTQANSTIALSLAKETKPSAMSNYNQDNLFWDEKGLESEALSNWSQFYFFVIGMAKVCLTIILPLLYLMLTAFALIGQYGGRLWIGDLGAVTLYAALPCLLIYAHFKLVSAGHLFLAPFLTSKRVYSLNRQTGMVTLFKKGNKVRFSHPFIEFDCVLMSAPSPQGHLNYNLMLVHRYHDYSVGVPIGNLVGSNELVAEYYRLWNMIQRYMDTSQPLPDILVLEPARERDPLTAEHDKKWAVILVIGVI
ncbi:hypothetical protein [Vibrio sp. C8]